MLGRRTQYWLFDQHPGAVSLIGGMRGSWRSRPVPARDIIHFFSPERPGAHRGFSGLSSIIAPTRDLRLYQDAEMARKNLESRLAVIASGAPELLADGQRSPDAKYTGELGALPSGGIFGLPEGVNITTVQPNVVPGYVDTVKFDLHLIAAGWGVPYEDMTGDMRESTWTSARMRRVAYRRERECVQELTVIPSLCRRIDRAFVEAARLANKIDRRSYGFTYTPPRWEDVNPQQDAAADLALVAGGLMSPSELIRRRGYDPKKVMAELQADIEAWRAAGLLDVLLAMQKARALAGDDNTEGGEAATNSSKAKAGSK
jgi:capsid protein